MDFEKVIFTTINLNAVYNNKSHFFLIHEFNSKTTFFGIFTNRIKFFIMKFFLLFSALFFSFIAFNQKKVIDHKTYNNWKKLDAQSISNDGNYVSYTIKPFRGDGYLYLYNTKTSKLDSFPRGYKQQFSSNSNFIVFLITAGFDTLRKCELNKIDKEKWPKDSLGIYLFETDFEIPFSNSPLVNFLIKSSKIKYLFLLKALLAPLNTFKKAY